MEDDETLASLDATDQSQLVATGQVSPRELIESAIRRVERIDPELGAVPVRFFEDALRSVEALDPSAPFAGVPFLMKDVGARQAGQPYYAANRALRAADHRAESDTVLGARFREIGLVTIGNSSTPEFGLQSNTWPLTYGPTRNPWDPTRAAGGSSGGACAAVAAGLVPVAHASDGAGSIRIPAAWCGLIGLKPSRDVVVWRHAGKNRPDVEFVVARSLRDTAALFDALQSGAARRLDFARFAKGARKPVRPLRIGFCLRSPDGSPVEESCRQAVERTVVELERAGHRVAPAAPAALFEYADRALFGTIFGPLGYRECLDELEERLGRPVEAHDVEPFLWELAAPASDAANDVSASEIDRAAEWLRAWERRLVAWFDDFDILVTPTVHETAPQLESLNPKRSSPMELLERMVPHMAFTEPWNATGQPAISLPLGWAPNGCPVGVQLVARSGAEPDLFAVSEQLLDALGESERRPVIDAGARVTSG